MVAVSYTHLDVYKRQPLHRWSTVSSLRTSNSFPTLKYYANCIITNFLFFFFYSETTVTVPELLFQNYRYA